MATSTPIVVTLETTSKGWYRSKAIWFNVISFALIVIPLFNAYVVGAGIGEETANQLGALLGLITAIGNAAIRFFWTSEPIRSSSGGAG